MRYVKLQKTAFGRLVLYWSRPEHFQSHFFQGGLQVNRGVYSSQASRYRQRLSERCVNSVCVQPIINVCTAEVSMTD